MLGASGVRRLVGWGLLLTLAGCGAASSVGAFAITHPLRVPLLGGPAEPHVDLTITTEDGLALQGWLFLPPSAPKGLVVFLHGKDINRGHFSSHVQPFLGRGYAVLAYDQRAHGRSEGTTITYGPKEVADLERALDLVGVTPVYLVGESLGAAVALQAAARDGRVAGVVAAASYSDLSTVIREHTPFFLTEAVTAEARRRAEAEWGFPIASISPARDAERIRVPTLLLHGTADTYIHPDHSRRIFAALAGPKELVWLEGVGHVDVLLRDRAWEAIERWFAAVTDAGRR